MRRHVSYALLALSIAGTAIACDDDDDPTGPDPELFRATMTGANEQPARTTTATGTANFTLNNDVLSWVVTLTGISNISGAHIHIGNNTVPSGGIVLPLGTTGAGGTLTNTGFSGSVTRAAYVEAQGLTFDELIAAMRTGGVYVNIHTQNTAVTPDNTQQGDYPGGEIRGQVNEVP